MSLVIKYRVHEVAKDLLLNKFSHRLGVLDIVDTEFVRNIKIVFASLYASFRRKKDIDELLLLLLDTIVVNELVEDEAAQGKIMNIVTKLASGGEIKSLPFSLNDINKKDAKPKLLSQILLSISLECPTDGKRIFRGKGEAVLEADKFSIIGTKLIHIIIFYMITNIYNF